MGIPRDHTPGSATAGSLKSERDRAAHEPSSDPAKRRRYFRRTPDGREVARLEAKRVKSLVGDSRLRRLLRAHAKEAVMATCIQKSVVFSRLRSSVISV